MVAGGGSAGFGPQRLARRGGDDGHYVVREDAGCAIQQASSAGRGDELLPVLRLARYGGDEALKLIRSLTSAGRRVLPAHFFLGGIEVAWAARQIPECTACGRWQAWVRIVA